MSETIPAAPETVRQLTLVQAVTGLIRLTCNANHFSKDPADLEHIHKVLRDTAVWWPAYAGVMAEARVNLLLAGQVIKDHFPGIVGGFPGFNEKATETLKRISVQLAGMDSEGNIPESISGTYTTQEFWLSVLAKIEKDFQTWREMYNLDVERKKNPGKLLVGKQWLEYGTVFHDDQQTEVVVINHQIVPKDSLELKAQGMENILAVMSAQFAAPAIALINELGGNMFAAICRGGIARIHGMVDSCYKASIADLKPEPEMLQRSLSGGVYEGQGGEATEAYLTKERPDHPMDELLK